MKTDFAKEILAIAHRIVAEKASGRSVDPSRLDWAKTIIAWNRVSPPTSPARVLEPEA